MGLYLTGKWCRNRLYPWGKCDAIVFDVYLYGARYQSVNIFSGSMFVATLNSVPNTLISVPWADTIKGWSLLCCISKYASPFSVTLRSLPENEVGYVIFESEFNQTVLPSDKISVEDVPFGELKV